MPTLEQVYSANTYNVAFKYLGDKYGYLFRSYTASFAKKLCLAKKKDVEVLMKTNATYAEKIHILANTEQYNEMDSLIYRLLKQYQYGMEPKKDLYDILISEKILVD